MSSEHWYNFFSRIRITDNNSDKEKIFKQGTIYFPYYDGIITGYIKEYLLKHNINCNLHCLYEMEHKYFYVSYINFLQERKGKVNSLNSNQKIGRYCTEFITFAFKVGNHTVKTDNVQLV